MLSSSTISHSRNNQDERELKAGLALVISRSNLSYVWLNSWLRLAHLTANITEHFVIFILFRAGMNYSHWKLWLPSSSSHHLVERLLVDQQRPGAELQVQNTVVCAPNGPSLSTEPPTLHLLAPQL